jgi:hypothetical protein
MTIWTARAQNARNLNIFDKRLPGAKWAKGALVGTPFALIKGQVRQNFGAVAGLGGTFAEKHGRILCELAAGGATEDEVLWAATENFWSWAQERLSFEAREAQAMSFSRGSYAPKRSWEPKPTRYPRGEALALAAPMAGKDASRPMLSCPVLHKGHAVATDGHRLVMVPADYPDDGPVLGCGEYVYPNYDQVIPKRDPDVVVILDGAALKAALKKVGGSLRFTPGDQGGGWLLLGVKGKGEEPRMGRSPLAYPDDGPVVALDAAYAFDALPPKGLVRVDIHGPLSPVAFHHEDGTLHVVMPMRL